MNFLCQGFQKLSSDRQTDRQTDTTEMINHAALRVVKNIEVFRERTTQQTHMSRIHSLQHRDATLQLVLLLTVKYLKTNWRP